MKDKKYFILTTKEYGPALYELNGKTFDEACENAEEFEKQGFPIIWVLEREDVFNLTKEFVSLAEKD